MGARVLCILCEKFYRNKIHVYVFDLFLKKMEENLFNKTYSILFDIYAERAWY